MKNIIYYISDSYIEHVFFIERHQMWHQFNVFKYFFYKTAYIVNLTFTINIVLQYRWKSKTISWRKRCYTFQFFAFQLSTICLALNKSGSIVVWTSPNWNINCVGIEQSCCGNIVLVLKLQILEFHEQISSRESDINLKVCTRW